MSDEEIELRKREEKLVAKVCSDLGEHFDNVRIFVSSRNDGQSGTRFQSIGCGSYFAQYGQIKQWVIMEDAQAKQERIDSMKDEE